MSTYEPYPAWRFNTSGESVVVLSAEEDSMLDKSWSDKVPENFRPEGHPTYKRTDFVPAKVDIEAIVQAVAETPERKKPGRKPKVI